MTGPHSCSITCGYIGLNGLGVILCRNVTSSRPVSSHNTIYSTRTAEAIKNKILHKNENFFLL